MESKIALVMAAIFAAFGIIEPPSNVAAGMFLCISFSYLAMSVSPPDNKLTLWSTLLLSICLGIVAAIAHNFLFTSYPVQIMMGAAGILSRSFLYSAVMFGQGISNRAGSWKLPWEKD